MLKGMSVMLMALAACVMMVGCGEKKDVAAGKTWIVATDTAFRPFEYTNEKNEFVGIDVDILAAIAADQGFQVRAALAGLGRRRAGRPGQSG